MPRPIPFVVTPTLITSAYTANTVLGGLLTIPGVPASGVIRDVVAFIDGSITPAMDLYFFDNAPTAILDNVAFGTLSHADQRKLIGGDKISIASADYQTINSKTRAPKRAVNLDFAAGALANYGYGLYLYAVTTGTPTFPSASALTIEVVLWPQ